MEALRGDEDGHDSASTFYEVLGVSQSAAVEAIKLQYRRRVLKCHPDKVPGKEVNPQAYYLTWLLIAPAPECFGSREYCAVARLGCVVVSVRELKPLVAPSNQNNIELNVVCFVRFGPTRACVRVRARVCACARVNHSLCACVRARARCPRPLARMRVIIIRASSV